MFFLCGKSLEKNAQLQQNIFKDLFGSFFSVIFAKWKFIL